MPKSFTITTASPTVVLDAEGHGKVTFSVVNATTRSIKGWPGLEAPKPTFDWLSIEKGGERTFDSGVTNSFTVIISVPAGVPSGRHSFKLNLISGTKGSEEESEPGPEVAFEVGERLVPPPPFPWKPILLIAALVILFGVAAWILIARGGQPKQHPVRVAFAPSATKAYPRTPVTFTNLSEGTPAGWLWSFGDGETDTNKTAAAHSYANPGGYDVRLMALDSQQVILSSNQVSLQVLQAPKAEFVAAPTTVPEGGSVTLVNQSEGDGLSWAWDFGDGTRSTEENPAAHRYPRAGQVTVTLTVTGPALGGTPASNVKRVSINVVRAPAANFRVKPSRGFAPLTVQFTDTSAGSPNQWTWNFGDGSPQLQGKNQRHEYKSPGRYDVTLTVDGPGGRSALTQNDVVVVEIPKRNVPVLKGKTVADAKTALERVQLKLGTVTVQRVSPFGGIGGIGGIALFGNKIISQSPAENQPVNIGTAINVVVWQ